MIVFRTEVFYVPASPLGLIGDRWVVQHRCSACHERVPGDHLLTHAQRCWSTDRDRTLWRTPGPQTPSCHDAVTITCPICQHSFTPAGRQKFCSDACRAAAYRRRRDATRPVAGIPQRRPRRPVTVYECDSCANRAVGEQRCADCATFMRKVGLGGECPHCAEPVAVTELLAQEVVATDRECGRATHDDA